MIRNIVKNFFSKPRFSVFVRNASASKNQEKIDEEIYDIENNQIADQDDELSKEDIERKRNKSRLRDHDRNLLYGNAPYFEPKTDYHHTVVYHRKLYGRYGNESGVNPGICWPTKEHLADIQEYERTAHPHSIQEMMAAKVQERRKFEDNQRARQEDIVKKFAKLEQWKKELRDKVAKKEAEALASKERKDRMVEEVRRHFGFKIDPRDERFKEMLEQKERAEKKAMKEAKRKVKEAKLIAKLQGKPAEGGAKAERLGTEMADT